MDFGSIMAGQHILFLVSGMQGGGAERVASLLCNYWSESGYKVTLMPTFSSRGECLYVLSENVDLQFLADRTAGKTRSVWSRLLRFWALRKFIYQEKPDAIVSFLTPVNVAALMAALGTSIPVIVSERSYPPARDHLGLPYEILRGLLYPLAAAVVMQTEQGLAWLSRSIPRSNGVVIPNPVQYPMNYGTPEVRPLEIVCQTRKICLCVGRLSEEKRFSEVISAFSRVAQKFPEWDLVILGEGSERYALEQKVTNVGLKDRVHLPGRVGNLSDWYFRAGAYVMNSRFEGFPNTLLEAMAHGVPVISRDCDTGPREIITNTVDGLLIQASGDSLALSLAMESIFGDPTFSRMLGQSAVRVRDRFSLDSIASKWVRVIELYMKKLNDG